MKKGFTLIELLIVITILAILAGAAVPYVQDYVEDARIAKAREDLGELRNAIMRYEVERGKLFDPANDGVGADAAEKLKNWQQMLVGPFLTQALTDPWGRPYYFSNAASMVFSGAEDGDKDTNIISVDVRPAMAPTRAWWYDIDRNGAVTANDYIDIKFTRPVGTLADLGSLEIASTSEFVAMVNGAANDGELKTDFADPAVHPKGQNWVRIIVGAAPQSALMAGSLIRAKANSIIDASTNSTSADTAGLYTKKIEPEKLFNAVPTCASTAIQVPVSIKSAQ
ncbi:MAG: prepilin-type N-terminal cleavage/methylation domain-containing protein [Candidatus Riflebacteria bacterium]|nr:prepilin-type N-terminal cleavage/methylation domain-containing protein [Candidatus Riflebacteria bacterium]